MVPQAHGQAQKRVAPAPEDSPSIVTRANGTHIADSVFLRCVSLKNQRLGALNTVILIEANEVPNGVLDAYARRSPFMAEFLAASDRYTTVCPDRIQLDPWIAWPTLHRGVPDEMHGILRLGQDTSAADAKYPPIWRLLKDACVSVGVCGSLFSGSEEDQSGYTFMLPDLFASHGRTKPEALERFQAFNLAMTRASTRNADEAIAAGGHLALAGLAMEGWVRPSTLARAGAQLASERLDRRRLSRRRNTQADLCGDVFSALVRRRRPSFATYHTNHVAAAMHRFWSASFAETSMNRDRVDPAWVDDYADEVFVALRSVERLLRRVKADAGPDTTIVVASAIGQEEIPAGAHRGFLTIKDPVAFIEAVLDDPWAGAFRQLPTMAPDFTFRFERATDAERARRRLRDFAVDDLCAVETLVRMQAKEVVADGSAMPHIRHLYAPDSQFNLPVTYGLSDERTLHVSLQVDDYAGQREARLGNRTAPLDAFGLGFVEHMEGVNCTAQHCAEGALAVHAPGGKRFDEVRMVSSLDFAPSILAHFAVDAPDYLPGKPIIGF